MIGKSVVAAIIVLSSLTGIKSMATTIGMKLFIMACAGLAGMYMIHLLAQDYNKYQSYNRNGRSVHEIVRRSLDSFDEFDFENSTGHKKLIDDINEAEEYRQLGKFLTIDRILQFDPNGCARRYVCTISAKPLRRQSQSEKGIIQMLRNLRPINSDSNSGQKAFLHALDLGRLKRDAQACADEYPKCTFSISKMLKLIGIS